MQARLRTLGRLELTLDGSPAPALPTQKARALLAYLALNPDREISRERLIELFWEEFEPERAREGLRTALSSIRRAARADESEANEIIVADRSIVRWAISVDVDAAEFERLSRSSNEEDWRAALKLYNGEFLEGNYEEWAAAQREHYADLYEKLLAKLVALHDDADAAGLLLARNPYEESAYALLIEKDKRAQRLVAARRTFERYRAAMEEGGLVPSREMLEKFGDLEQDPNAKASIAKPRPLRVLPNNLPARITPLIGRMDEVCDIEALLERARLVTVAGPGGIGKTRVSLEVATDLLQADGAWFVDLGPVSDPELVSAAVAEVFAVPNRGSRPLIDYVVAAIRRKKLLMVLDNCEHVIAPAANIVSRLLRDCPDVRVLATSREPLSVPGEEVFRMPALPVPPEGLALDVSGFAEYASVALFVARAQAVKRDFALDESNAPIVAEIARRLDGIALAIELAAARVRVLEVHHLSAKLVERFKLLTGGARTALPRQQTLHALIDWSYGLLNENEKRIFRRASLFAGEFTLELACAAGDCRGTEEFEILDLLTSLVDKSLLYVDQIEGEERYRFLESTREFAREKLVECGEYVEAAHRHAVALLNLAERLDEEWTSNRGSENVLRSRRELDNWRAALRWTLRERGDVALGSRLVAALRFAWARFAPAEGRGWIAQALAVVPLPAKDVLARLHLSDAHLAMLLMQYNKALSAAKQARTLCEIEGNKRLTAESQLMAGAAAGFLGFGEEAELELRASLNAFRALNACTDAGSALQYLGVVRMNAGDIDGSRRFYSQALEAYKAAGADALAAHLELQMAEAEFQSGDVIKALQLARDALASDRARGEENSIVYDLDNLAAYELAIDLPSEAAAHANEALALSNAIGSDTGFAFALQRLASVAAIHASPLQGDALPRLAATILGFVDRSFEELEYAREYTEKREYERALAALDRSIGADVRATLISEGRTWSRERAMKGAEAIAAEAQWLKEAL